MTRDELIEAMARAIIATGERVAFPKLFATAAISAIEAAGFAIVPVVASEGMVDVFNKYHAMRYHPNSPYRCAHTWKAMLAAAQEQLK